MIVGSFRLSQTFYFCLQKKHIFTELVRKLLEEDLGLRGRDDVVEGGAHGDLVVHLGLAVALGVVEPHQRLPLVRGRAAKEVFAVIGEGDGE